MNATDEARAQRIRIAIAASGHNKSSISAHCGVTASSVSHWCSGQAVPRPHHLEKLSAVTGASVSWLTHPHPVSMVLPDDVKKPRGNGVRASDLRPDDPFNGQRPVDEVVRKRP